MLGKKLYLVMACHELGDQWECDADREPMFVTDSKNKAMKKKGKDYPYEVYEIDPTGQNIKRIKEYCC